MPRRSTMAVAGPLAALLLVLASCSQSGGGSPVRPVLVAASFGGAGPAPTAGDLLVLSFSESMLVTAGAAVGDTDLVLSSGGTLGAGTTVTDQPTPNSVRLTLGTGVSFTPGATTVVLATTNAVFADVNGSLGNGGTPVVIGTGDGSPPTISRVTLDRIDGLLNGTGPAGGRLQVPQNGWSIDLAYADVGLGVVPARTQILANVAVTASGATQPAGTNLRPFLTAQTETAATASYLVPPSVVFPGGPLTLTCMVVDAGGLASSPATFLATVHPWTDALRPFETTVNPRQVWFLDLARDIESFSARSISGGAAVDIVNVANGRADFLDILFVLGMQAAVPIPNVSGPDDSNVVALSRFKVTLLTELGGFFTGANIQFTFTRPAGSFGGNASVPYNSLGFSQISIAGAADTPGVLGVAQFDLNNQRQNDDTLLQNNNASRLGVFLHTLADAGLGPPSTSAFRFVFNNFAPVLGGSPIGTAPDGLDGQRLTGQLNDARADRMDDAIHDLARFVAVVLAHECGHSMGLVADGPMPTGLYGGDAVNFPGSTSGHIRVQALFPSGTNIMSPQLAYSVAIDPATAFDSLNLAYLREQAFYGN